jgi:DNA-binding CsgD family transcriptional regulator
VSARPPNREASSARSRPLRRATIEYWIDGDSLAGTVTFDRHSQVSFSGVEQLERCLGLGSGRLVLVKGGAEDIVMTDAVAALTPTERQIVEAAAAGASNREIAESLYYSVKSIEAYLTRAYRRFGISGRDQLASVLAADADLAPSGADADRVAGGAGGGPAPGGAGPRQRVRLVVV